MLSYKISWMCLQFEISSVLKVHAYNFITGLFVYTKSNKWNKYSVTKLSDTLS
jgi:hypothetical protein